MANVVLAKNISTYGTQIEQVYTYKYLGHEIKLGRDNQTTELNRRIGLTWAAYEKLRDVYIPMWLKSVCASGSNIWSRNTDSY